MADALEAHLGAPPSENPLYKAAVRCLRVLMEHAGLTPEVVAEKTDWSPTEVEVMMDQPVLLSDYMMLWDLCVEEHEDLMDKCAATIRILIERNEVDQEMIDFLASIGHLYLFFGGEFVQPELEVDA